ncbi:MAG: T9SS type A sorting domain-containing protein [Bacteroidales bacterium]|jgi:hypothetical protein
MKKLILLLLILTKITNLSYSQVTYFNYFDYSSHWGEFDHLWGSGDYYVEYYFKGDTLINGNWYYKLYRYQKDTIDTIKHFNYYGGIREDSLKRIYFVNTAHINEHLLYDFNLSIGDTVFGTPCILTSIDTFYFGANLRKIYHFNNLNDTASTEYEGIGKATDLLDAFYGLPCATGHEGVCRLVCYSNKDGYKQFISSHICRLSAKVEENYIENKINIYPIPSNDELIIEIPRLIRENFLTICNIKGQELMRQQIKDSKTQINISNLTSGIYFVKLITDKTVEVRKILKE